MLPQLPDDLRRPEAYTDNPEKVEFLETHISWLFLTPERVFKVKKPVALGFLDFTALEQRKHFCEEEVRLNSRLSPEVYLGVLPITVGADGHAVVGGKGPIVDWAVEMVRLPAHDMLEEILKRGEVDNRLMNSLVNKLVRFHHEAATGEGVNEHGSPRAILGNVEENFRQLREYTPRTAEFDTAAWRTGLTFLEARQLSFMDRNRGLFERRVRQGRIRDGHGDLHASNICVTGSNVRIYDCIEFSDRLRCSDVACDLAFIAMDLDHRDAPAFSRYLVHRYSREAGDPGVMQLIDFYKVYRALVRCKVAAITAASDGISPELAAEKSVEAMRLLNLALSYEMPPAMILMCGLPASGKSWLAKRISHTLRGVFLQSDVRRKILAGILPTAPAREAIDSGLYAPEMKDKTYRFLLRHAVDVLLTGRTVFVDATFSKAKYRRPFIDAAARLELPCFVLHVTAPEDVTRKRLEARKHARREPSDADLAVYLRAVESFEPLDEVPEQYVIQLDTSLVTVEEATARLMGRMIVGELLQPAPFDLPLGSRVDSRPSSMSGASVS